MKLFRATHVVIGMLCLMYFITYLDRVNVSTAAAGFGPEFGLNKTQIGLVFSAFAYPYLVFQIIGGWVSDRFGARRTLIVCGALWATATVLTGLAGSLFTMLLARVLLGLGEGATFPAATSAMARWVSHGARGFAQGITHAAARIGNAAAPAAIVATMAAFGWRAAFYLCAAISFVWVIGWAMVFTEQPKDHPRITPGELASLPLPRGARPALDWGRLFRRMWPVTLVYFCYGWTLWLFLSWIPQYFLHSYNLNLGKSALFSSLRRETHSTSFRGAGRFAGRLGHRPHPAAHRQPAAGAQRHGVGVHGAVPAVAVAAAGAARPDLVGHQPVGRLLLCRAVHRSDVGHPHGHRARAQRHGQRHDEHRLGLCSHRLAGGFGLADRPLRQLGVAVCGQHAADGGGPAAGPAHAP